MTAQTNLTMAKIKTQKTANKASKVAKGKHRNFLGKLFGQRYPKPNLEKDLNDVNSIYDILDNPVRSKRGGDNLFSDFTEAYEYKKSTLPIIMDTTTNDNAKKHLGYVNLQSKTTTTASSPELNKKRGKFKKFLNKMLHKKQKNKQKRDVLKELHRELRFNPFKKLKAIFQATSTTKGTSKVNTDVLTTSKNGLLNKAPNIDEMMKQSEKHLTKKTKIDFENKHTPLLYEDFERQTNIPQNDDVNVKFTLDELVGKYQAYKYDPMYFKLEEYLKFETDEPKNEKFTSDLNKILRLNDVTTDNMRNNDFTFGFKIVPSKLIPTLKFHKPSSKYDYDRKFNTGTASHSNDNLDPKIKMEPSPKFVLNDEDFSKFKTSPDQYDQSNKYEPDVTFDEIFKYGHFDQHEPRVLGYPSNNDPLWKPTADLNDLQKKLDENRAHGIDETGKLNKKYIFKRERTFWLLVASRFFVSPLG